MLRKWLLGLVVVLGVSQIVCAEGLVLSPLDTLSMLRSARDTAVERWQRSKHSQFFNDCARAELEYQASAADFELQVEAFKVQGLGEAEKAKRVQAIELPLRRVELRWRKLKVEELKKRVPWTASRHELATAELERDLVEVRVDVLSTDNQRRRSELELKAATMRREFEANATAVSKRLVARRAMSELAYWGQLIKELEAERDEQLARLALSGEKPDAIASKADEIRLRCAISANGFAAYRLSLAEREKERRMKDPDPVRRVFPEDLLHELRQAAKEAEARLEALRTMAKS